MPIKNIDYSKTIIYKIMCKDINIKDIYVGHTTNFTMRKTQHKSSCNNIDNPKYNYKLYKCIRENGGWDNWQMVIVADVYCLSKIEARQNEDRFVMQLLPTLNMATIITKTTPPTEEQLKASVKCSRLRNVRDAFKKIQPNDKLEKTLKRFKKLHDNFYKNFGLLPKL